MVRFPEAESMLYSRPPPKRDMMPLSELSPLTLRRVALKLSLPPMEISSDKLMSPRISNRFVLPVPPVMVVVPDVPPSAKR